MASMSDWVVGSVEREVRIEAKEKEEGEGAWGRVCDGRWGLILLLGPRMECGRALLGERASCMAEVERRVEDDGVGRPGLTRTGPEGSEAVVGDGFLFSFSVCFPVVLVGEGGVCSTGGFLLPGLDFDFEDSACSVLIGSLKAVNGRSALSDALAGTDEEVKFSGAGVIRCPSVDPRPGCDSLSTRSTSGPRPWSALVADMRGEQLST